jgi:hypothetical protein
MNDVIYRVERAYANEHAEWRQRQQLQLSFDELLDAPPSQVEEVATDRLADGIYESCRPHRSLTFRRLQERMVYSWFGRATESHYRDACKLLVRQKRIRRDREAGIKADTVLEFT